MKRRREMFEAPTPMEIDEPPEPIAMEIDRQYVALTLPAYIPHQAPVSPLQQKKIPRK